MPSASQRVPLDRAEKLDHIDSCLGAHCLEISPDTDTLHAEHPGGGVGGRRRQRDLIQVEAKQLVCAVGSLVLLLGQVAEAQTNAVGLHRPPRQPRELRDLRDLLRQRVALTQMRSALKNRVHALIARQGIRHQHTDLFGKAGLVFLAELELREPPRRRLARCSR
jgi:hypothetical protein